MKKTLKSSSYLKVHSYIPLNRTGLTVYAYDKEETFLGKVEINYAGLDVWAGRKRIARMSWEKLFKSLGH